MEKSTSYHTNCSTPSTTEVVTEKCDTPANNLNSSKIQLSVHSSSFKFVMGPLQIELDGVSVIVPVFLSSLIIICSTVIIIYFLGFLFSTSFLVPISILFLIWIGLRFADRIFGTNKKAEVELSVIQNEFLKADRTIYGEIRKREIEKEENISRLDKALKARRKTPAILFNSPEYDVTEPNYHSGVRVRKEKIATPCLVC